MSHEVPELRRAQEFADAPPRTSRKATTALILSILSCCMPVLLSIATLVYGMPIWSEKSQRYFWVLLSITAMVFGSCALMDVKNGRNGISGKRTAIAGLVLGSLSLFSVPFGMIAVVKVGESGIRVQNISHLKQINVAFASYHDVYKSLPPATVYSKEGRHGQRA